MKTYEVEIKSHCEAPDWCMRLEAENEDEAIKEVCRKYDWDEETVQKNICEVSDSPTGRDLMGAF